MGRTAGEAGWRVSRYNLAARIPDSDKVAVANLYRGTCGAYTPVELYLLDEVESLDENHPILKRFRDRGLIVNFDELAALNAQARAACASNFEVGLTICPTLGCNFDCPYCFENHHPGRMSQQTQDDVIALAERMMKASGAASLTMVMAYYGKWVPLEQVRSDCGVSRDGSKASNIYKAAKAYGFDAKAFRLSPEGLRTKGKFPCIIHWGFNHFVLMNGFKGKYAYINDPARGFVKVGPEEFDQEFTGIVIELAPGPDFQPSGKPKSTLSFARKRLVGAGSAVAFVMLTTAIGYLFGIINSVTSRIFMDRLLTGQNQEWLVPFISAMVLLALIQIAVAWAQAVYSLKINGKMAAIGSTSYMWKVLRMPMEFFSQRLAGDIQGRLVLNASVAGTLVNTFAPVLLNTVMMVFYLALMLRQSLVLTLVGVTALVINMVMARVISNKRINITRVQMRDAGKLQATAASGIAMIETIKSSGAENGFFQKWAGFQASVNTQNVKSKRTEALLGKIPLFFTNLANYTVLVLGVLLTMQGKYTLGGVMMFQGFLTSFMTPAMTLVSAGQAIQEMRTQMERIEDVMEYNGKTPRQQETLGESASLYVQGEDCLYLNIWKADDAGAEKKPVMVWIHGGAFEMGGTVDPVYDCHNLVAENPDVIVASIEYRVGVFGFFHLSHLPDGADYPDAQNLGLMDQMMALKWIHENIAGFGGDPDNVTIFGESAGGGSVTLLPLVEGSHEYFQRVIAQSGAPVFTRSTEEAIACTDEVMDILGCETVADLQEVDDEELVQITASMLGLRVWAERDGSFLPEDPYEAYANGAAKDIDILQGCNKDEMGYFILGFGLELYNEWAAGRLETKLSQMTEEEQALAKSYLEVAKDVTDEYSSTSRLFDQIVFIAPLFRLSENQAMAGGKSYTYFFTPESSIPMLRSGHSVELYVVFDQQEDSSMRPFDETFSRTLRRMWVQFAKTGDPSLSADLSPDGTEKIWPIYDIEDKQVMIFDEFDIHPEKESERGIIDWDRTYFLIKYYCI